MTVGIISLNGRVLRHRSRYLWLVVNTNRSMSEDNWSAVDDAFSMVYNPNSNDDDLNYAVDAGIVFG